MRHSNRLLVGSALALAAAAALWAGGLFVMPGNPDANPEAKARKAVLVLKLAGCHDPQNALLTGKAITSTNGEPKVITLKLEALSEPGTYSLSRQWPEKGRWVLEFVAKDQGRITSTLISAGPNGIDRENAKMGMHEPAPEEVTAMLAGGVEKDLARK